MGNQDAAVILRRVDIATRRVMKARLELAASQDELGREWLRLQELVGISSASQQARGRTDRTQVLAGPQRSERANVPGGKRRRAVNAVPLPQALHRTIGKKTMSIAQAAQAVMDSGFKTYSRSFRVMVNMALTTNPKLFKRVSRGQYTTK